MSERLIPIVRRWVPGFLKESFEAMVLRWRAHRLADTVLCEMKNTLEKYNVTWLESDERGLVADMRGVTAYWVSRGGIIDCSTIQENVLEAPRDVVGVHVCEFQEKLALNLRTPITNTTPWEGLTKLAGYGFTDAIHTRVEGILVASGYETNTHPGATPVDLTRRSVKESGLRLFIWTEPHIKAYNEDDGWYSHVLLSFDMGMIVPNPKET